MGARTLATADFNGDGNLDLAVGNNADSTVSILLGNGDGTFQAGRAFATGPNAFSVAAGDFNGDSLPDLAVADAGGKTVSILLGKEGGTSNRVK